MATTTAGKVEANRHVSLYRAYCKARDIPTTGVLAITVQKNRTTEFSAAIIDFEHEKVLSHYPADKLSTYNKKREGDFLVAYLANLEAVAYDQTSPKGCTSQKATADNGPFCCSSVVEYKGRRISAEKTFSDFIKGAGHHPNVVYEVKRQVNNGPMISTRYFTLVHDKITEAPSDASYNQKVHAFKNYKCNVHDLFFGVDLYRQTATTGYNFHHMRLNPFTRVNADVLGAFFAEVGVA